MHPTTQSFIDQDVCHPSHKKPKGGITYTRAKSYRALSDALKLLQCYGALGVLSALVFCRAKGVKICDTVLSAFVDYKRGLYTFQISLAEGIGQWTLYWASYYNDRHWLADTTS